jgi:hypothetical protein
MSFRPKNSVSYGRALLLWSLVFSVSFSALAFAPKSASCLLRQLDLLQNIRTGHVADPVRLASKISAKEKELEGLAFEGVIPWGPKKRDVVKRFLIEKAGMSFMAQKQPIYSTAQKLGKAEVDVNDILWSQIRCRNMSQDGKYSVVSNAKAIKDGTLDISVLPTIRVWRDTEGRIWTLDHRRLAAVKLSGVIEKITVEFVDEALVKAQQFKFDSHNDGKSLFVWLDEKGATEDLAIVLVNKKKVGGK